MQIAMGSLVKTEFGLAQKVGWLDDQEGLFLFEKKFYTEEGWRLVSPANGPCVFKALLESSVSIMQPNREQEDKIIKAKKSGKRYQVLRVQGAKVRIKSLENGQEWDTTEASITRNFEVEC